MFGFITVIGWMIISYTSNTCTCVETIANRISANNHMVWTRNIAWYNMWPFYPEEDSLVSIDIIQSFIICK